VYDQLAMPVRSGPAAAKLRSNDPLNLIFLPTGSTDPTAMDHRKLSPLLGLFLFLLHGCTPNCDCRPCEREVVNFLKCHCEHLEVPACAAWEQYDNDHCSCACTTPAARDCGDHGTANTACACVCETGWCGSDYTVQVVPCGPGESWDNASCSCVGGCPPGYYGPDCSTLLPSGGYLAATLVNTTIGDTFVFVSDLQDQNDQIGLNGANSWSAFVVHSADVANTFSLYHVATTTTLDTTTYPYPQNLGSDIVVDRAGWPPATAGGLPFPQMESGWIRYHALPVLVPGVIWDVRFAYGITSNGIHIEVVDGRCYRPQ